MRSNLKGVGFIAVLGIALLLVGASAGAATNKVAKLQRPEIHFGSLAVPFVENRGQVGKEVSLYAKTFGGTVFLTKDGQIVYSLLKREKNGAEGVVFKEFVLGASPQVGGKVLSKAKVNIFKGKDSSRWFRGLSAYDVVTLGEVAKGVTLDLKAYNKKVEKIFTFAPKADVSSLKIELKGAKALSVDKKGRLVVKTDAGTFYFTRPVAYQPLGDGGRVFVDAQYKVHGNTYSFEVSKYDASKPLVIDPLLASTFLGGDNGDEGWDIALANNSVYVVGHTYSTNFPATTGSYSGTNAGESDVFVARFSGDLSELWNCTYIGGNSTDEGYGIAANSSAVCITGTTNSSNYPTTGGAFCATNQGDYDAFVSCLNPALSTLLGSTYVGGNHTDVATDIALGSVYIVGYTNSTTFLGCATAALDGFVVKFNNTLSGVEGVSLITGEGNEAAYGVTVMDGNVYVAGYTNTGIDDYAAFIARYDSNLLPSGYGGLDTGVRTIDTDNDDAALGITNDGSNVFITGMTGDNVLLGKVDSSGNTACAYLSNDGYALGKAIYYSNGSLYLTGTTCSTDLETGGFYDDTFNGGGNDSFVAVVSPGAIGESPSQNCGSGIDANATYLGSTGDDYGEGIVVNGTGIYVVGRTGNETFPTTAGAYDTSYNGGAFDAFVALFDNLLGYQLTVNAMGPAGSGNATMDDLATAAHSLSGATHTVAAQLGGASWSDTYSKDTDVPLNATTNAEQYKFVAWNCTGPGVAINTTDADITVRTNATITCNATFDWKYADLGISKTVDRTSAFVGDVISYTLTVHNYGPDCATGVQIVDTLPDGFEFACATAGCNYDSNSGNVTCDWGILSSGGDAVVVINGTVECPASSDNMTNVAYVYSTSRDDNATNDESEVSTGILAHLHVDKGGDCSTCYEAATIVSDVNGTNGGINCGSDCDEDYSANTNVTLSFSGLPEYCHFVEWNCTHCNGTGNIDTNPTHTVAMDGNVTCNATFNINHADLVVDKSGNSTVNVGQTITYNISVVNFGPDCATGVWLIDALPPETTFVSATASNGGCCTHSGGTVNCELGTLSYPSVVHVTITATAPNTEGNVTNQVLANSTSQDDNLTNNYDNFTTEVLGYLLKVVVSGKGTVTSNPAGINCGADCEERYNLNQVVQLTAAEDPGNSYFDHWEGDCAGDTKITNVTMNSDKTCTAVFKDIKIPDPPKNFKAQIIPCEGPGTNAKVILTWDKVSDAKGYMIWNVDSGVMLAWIKDPNVTTYTLYSLQCDNVYHLAIQTQGQTVNSKKSDAITVGIPSCDQCEEEGNNTPISPPKAEIDVIWPTDNSNINYDDFDAADGLIVFAWNTVKNAAGYKMYLALDDGGGPQGGEFMLKKGNGPGELIIVPEANLAGIYFVVNKAVWNALAKYQVIWKVTAVDSSGHPMGDTGEVSFGFNSVE